MGPFINDCDKHIYAWIDGEWIDVTVVLDACVHLAEEEDEIPDEDIPFCDKCCDDCDVCDQMDDYKVVDEDDFDDLYDDPPMWGVPDIRRIVFNDPATIVFWDDGTKTVVKTCEGDKFERYMGFAAACMKKMFGSTSRAKAIMNECDTENMKHWQEEALKPKAQSETKPEPEVNKYEPKYKPLDYGLFIETLEKFMHTFDNMEDRMKKEKKDGTSEA